MLMHTRQTPGVVSREIAIHLERHGCPAHAAGAQRYFKDEVKCWGWRTKDLRSYARAVHAALAPDPELLLNVAERLFAEASLEEKGLGVLILQPSMKRFGGREFRRLEGWLDRVATWADHDTLTMTLLGPMIVADPRRVARPLRWAASRDRWHKRASAVSLIPGIRQGLFMEEGRIVTDRLAADRDDMVQKGLGWLLREWAKHHPAEAIPVLAAIRGRASRLVLRTGCEKLDAADRQRILRK